MKEKHWTSTRYKVRTRRKVNCWKTPLSHRLQLRKYHINGNRPFGTRKKKPEQFRGGRMAAIFLQKTGTQRVFLRRIEVRSRDKERNGRNTSGQVINQRQWRRCLRSRSAKQSKMASAEQTTAGRQLLQIRSWRSLPLGHRSRFPRQESGIFLEGARWSVICNAMNRPAARWVVRDRIQPCTSRSRVRA